MDVLTKRPVQQLRMVVLLVRDNMAMIWSRTPSFPSPKIDGDIDQEDDKELELKKERRSKVSSVLRNSPSSVAENFTLPADFTNRAERTFQVKSTVMSEFSQILLTENFTSNTKYRHNID